MKLVTIIAAMQHAERGLISLNGTSGVSCPSCKTSIFCRLTMLGMLFRRARIRLLSLSRTPKPLCRLVAVQGADEAESRQLNVRDFKDVYNDLVVLYVLTDSRWKLLAITLHNYIYRRWFRPYRQRTRGLQDGRRHTRLARSYGYRR